MQPREISRADTPDTLESSNHIGTTFAQATTPSDVNLLNLDMTDWGGDRSAAQKRNNTPWALIRLAMVDYRTYVEEKVTNACPWHKWQ